VAPLLARSLAAICCDVEALAARLQSNERLLRREVQEFAGDPAAGACQGLCPVKARSVVVVVCCRLRCGRWHAGAAVARP
jgi:hypothetical protein